MAKMRTELETQFTAELEAQEIINNDLNNSIGDLKKKVNLLSQVYFRKLSFEVEKKIKKELGIATDGKFYKIQLC
jgi:antitoxin component HigA of HigAB toxin-antitoxin module